MSVVSKYHGLKLVCHNIMGLHWCVTTLWAYTCQIYVLQNFNIFSVLRMTGRLIPGVEFWIFDPLFWCNLWKWHCVAETCSSGTYHECVLWFAINFTVLFAFTLQNIGWFQLVQDAERWRALLNTAINRRVPRRSWKMLSVWATMYIQQKAAVWGP